MLTTILPPRADNDFRGHRLAPWLLGLVLLPRIAIGLGSIFNGRNGAAVVDGIPLASYPTSAVEQVVNMLALLGLASFTFGALGFVVLLRYRSLIPAMFATLLLYQGGRQAIHHFIPTESVGTAPGAIVNLVLLAMMLGGFALSLVPRQRTTRSFA